MGYEKITEQFMLCDNVLVAPVTEENLKIKKIILPQGKWKTADGEIYHGGEIEINCKNDTLPVFVKEQ